MRTPFDLGWLKHTLSLHGVKNLKAIVGKIVEAFNKASLPLDVNEIVGFVRDTDWSDPTVIMVGFIISTFTLLISPYIGPLLSSPRQTFLALHFRWGAR